MDNGQITAYIKIALDTVIKYAKEQGVKLRYSDFPPASSITNEHFFSSKDGNGLTFFDGKNPSFAVKISYNGRWAAQIKKAQERFYNYVNARVQKNNILFTFSVKELDLLRVKNEGESEGVSEKDIEAVIKKVTKLLALADVEKNPSEQEAVAASLAAQRLLAKYNLSFADVTGERRPEEDIEQVITDVGKGNKWKYMLSDVVAKNYACKTYSCGAEMIIFYGYKADVLIARRVFIYLFKVGNRLANQYVKNFREETWGGDASGIYNSFVSGFTAGVRRELEKQCTALALVVQPEVQSSWDKFSESMKAVDRRVEAVNMVAYEEGVIEGKRALNAQYLEEG